MRNNFLPEEAIMFVSCRQVVKLKRFSSRLEQRATGEVINPTWLNSHGILTVMSHVTWTGIGQWRSAMMVVVFPIPSRVMDAEIKTTNMELTGSLMGQSLTSLCFSGSYLNELPLHWRHIVFFIFFCKLSIHLLAVSELAQWVWN